jgi:transcriptional regulator with XRE-family HTH domain
VSRVEPPTTDELRARFGLNLRAARARVDVSQEELAFRAGLNRTGVSPLEQGKTMPRIDTVIRLAGAAEVTPNDLAAGIVWTPWEAAIIEAGGFVVPDDPDLAAEVAKLREEGR